MLATMPARACPLAKHREADGDFRLSVIHPATRNSYRVIRSPQRATRDPQRATRNPQPVARNPQPVARNP